MWWGESLIDLCRLPKLYLAFTREKKNGYLIIIINGITEKLPVPCKQIRLASVLQPANRKVLHLVWKISR